MNSKIWYIPARNDRLEKKVGIYCRVSTAEKEQLYSLAEQISALTRAVANVSQWRLADVFIDIASAKGDIPRREFERLMKECEAHNISVVLTKSISRFGRDTVETLTAINKLKAAGVRVIFEQENLDTDEVDSDLMISVMESLAQAENESRSENIRMGLAMRAANGTSGLYKRKLYGYTKNINGELVIDEEQSKKDVTSKYIDWDHPMYIPAQLHEELSKRISPRKGDILLAKNGTTGIAAIVDRDCVFDIYVSLALLRFYPGQNIKFMWAAINIP